MHRKFIAIILAAAVAVTGLGAVPAAAGEKELKRILLGVAALGIIAAAIENDKRRDNSRANGPVTRQQTYYPPVVHAPPRGHGPYKGYVAPRPLPDRARADFLPGDCLRSVSDRRGTRNVYVAGCLEHNHVQVSRLPDACQLSVIGQDRGRRDAFDARCLADYGYRSGRR